MPFKPVLLNDGRYLPAIGFGTWKIPKEVCTGEVDQAVEVGFDHIDTAQTYRNEEEVGQAIKELGLARNELWVTTKWSGTDGKQPKQSCAESLEKLGLEYIDLYLIHNPRLCEGDIPGHWKQMEDLYRAGKVKSIGVSNFSVEDLQTLLASCSVKPVVNQILLHPYVIGRTEKLLEFHAQQHIVTEAYSALYPLTSAPGGPVDKPVSKIAEKYSVKPEQVLLAWAKAKKAVILSTSRTKERLEGYLAVGDLDLTDDEVAELDKAGRKGELWEERKKTARSVGRSLLVGAAIVAAVKMGRKMF